MNQSHNFFYHSTTESNFSFLDLYYTIDRNGSIEQSIEIKNSLCQSETDWISEWVNQTSKEY